MEEHEKMLTPTEAGRRMGVGDRTVKRWIEAGKLRGYRPGKAYQIPESAVEELLKESEIRPKDSRPEAGALDTPEFRAWFQHIGAQWFLSNRELEAQVHAGAVDDADEEIERIGATLPAEVAEEKKRVLDAWRDQWHRGGDLLPRGGDRFERQSEYMRDRRKISRYYDSRIVSLWNYASRLGGDESSHRGAEDAYELAFHA